jgi:Na+/H+ antiporter NhaD/arsenite permease-like protein
VVSFYFLLKDDVGKKKVKKTKEILVHIPMGVLFFGVSFFILTYAFATSPWVSKEVIPLMLVLLKSNEFVVSFFGIFSSGFLVNIFNDLPAANLLGVVLGNSVFLDVFNNSLLLKSVLFGLNIGCIVTPIGALAGIVWFHLIKVETSKYKGTNFIVPTKIDLFKYGTLIFFVVGTISAMILPTFLHVYKFIIGPVN